MLCSFLLKWSNVRWLVQKCINIIAHLPFLFLCLKSSNILPSLPLVIRYFNFFRKRWIEIMEKLFKDLKITETSSWFANAYKFSFTYYSYFIEIRYLFVFFKQTAEIRSFILFYHCMMKELKTLYESQDVNIDIQIQWIIVRNAYFDDFQQRFI